jgi:hypothetical protein
MVLRRTMMGAWFALVFATSSLPAAYAQSASDDVAAAHALYEEGAKAHARGDDLVAARTFAKADELAPDASALQAALVSVLRTNDAVLGMDLVGRSNRESFNAELMKLAEKARAKFANKAGRIVVHCSDCQVTIDGDAARRGVAKWVSAGAHQVAIDVDGRRETREVLVEATSIVTILPMPPGAGSAAVPPVPTEASSAPVPPAAGEQGTDANTGPSPVYFWIGLGLSGAFAAGALASTLNTDSIQSDFLDNPSEELSQKGQDAELRSNVLWGVTAGVATITAAIGIFLVDWSGEPNDSAWQLTPDGVRVSF